MILVQDQNKQGNRTKNFDPELQFKQETTKQSLPDPKEELWEGDCGWKRTNRPKESWGLSCDEELLTSANDTDEEEDNFFEEGSEYPEEIHGARRHNNTLPWKKPFKNVRFEGSDFNYVLDTSETSSLENEHADRIGCGYEEHVEEHPMKMSEHLRTPCTLYNWKNVDRYDMKYERRAKSSPEKSNCYLDVGDERRPVSLDEYAEITEPRQRMERKEHRCPDWTFHGDGDTDHVCEELHARKSRYKFDYGNNMREQRHGDCCDYRTLDNEMKKRSCVKPKSVHKHHFCRMNESPCEEITKAYKKSCRDNRVVQDKQFDSFLCHTKVGRHCSAGDYFGKGKKKMVEVVQERRERSNDVPYRTLCSKFSSHTEPNDFNGCKRIQEKIPNSSRSDWLPFCSNRNSADKMLQSYKFHQKMKSRRTRMNRLKNGWKKAFVQTIRDRNRNERVGVIVMGPKGPEFYSKNKQTENGAETFQNSDQGPKSFEVMTVDCKNVYLSSSEPRTFGTSQQLSLPEDEAKVDEKLANFSKNVNDIVKTSEEKFYKALSSKGYLEKNKTSNEIFAKSDEKDAGIGKQSGEEKNEEEKENLKKPPFHLLQFEGLPPTISKSLRKRERKFNEESKTMADALNKQAKEYKENQLKENNYMVNLKQLQQEFPPKEISEETAKANLSVWGMTLEHLSERKDRKKEQGDGDDVKSDRVEHAKHKTPEGNVAFDKEISKFGKGEIVQTALDQSLSPQISRKLYETTTGSRNVLDKCAGDGTSTMEAAMERKANRLTSTATTTTAATAATKWTTCSGDALKTCDQVKQETDPTLISEMFRDLVENGCAISQEESENLQSLFRKANAEACSNEAVSEASSEVLLNSLNARENKDAVSMTETSSKILKGKTSQNENSYKENKESKKPEEETEENELDNSNAKKMFKLKANLDEKIFRRFQNKGKSKKKIVLEDKMKVLREALPSIAAENEAAHLKQLKKYIERFIERVEASTCTEFQKRKHNRHKVKDVISTDSSEVRVDARKILDIVNNPFKTISSDVTINIAKKLTDALVQDKTNRGPKNAAAKIKKVSEAETDDERFQDCGATSSTGKFSGSENLRPNLEPFFGKTNLFAVVTLGFFAFCGVFFIVKKYQWEESEPTYLKQLKKMRNQHLNNIVLEVKKLNDLLRFLDRCSHVKF